MRCEERGVDRFECPSVSVLYHYPSLKIDRSYLKKEIRCHAFTVHGGALSPPSSSSVCCGFCSHYIRAKPQTHLHVCFVLQSLDVMRDLQAQKILKQAINVLAKYYKTETKIRSHTEISTSMSTKQMWLFTSVHICVCVFTPQREPQGDQNQRELTEGE